MAWFRLKHGDSRFKGLNRSRLLIRCHSKTLVSGKSVVVSRLWRQLRGLVSSVRLDARL